MGERRVFLGGNCLGEVTVTGTVEVRSDTQFSAQVRHARGGSVWKWRDGQTQVLRGTREPVMILAWGEHILVHLSHHPGFSVCVCVCVYINTFSWIFKFSNS